MALTSACGPSPQVSVTRLVAWPAPEPMYVTFHFTGTFCAKRMPSACSFFSKAATFSCAAAER
ncbi:hypothetical protein ABT072_41080 [Streptomyces sp. NPDC002589]|uniref:hypothetical protein n=1 Tax=Streptomyces sp. NPDC002589 TaxID=3154420 RepID=UPI0033342AEB